MTAVQCSTKTKDSGKQAVPIFICIILHKVNIFTTIQGSNLNNFWNNREEEKDKFSMLDNGQRKIDY